MRRSLVAMVAVALALGLGAAVLGHFRVQHVLEQAQKNVTAQNQLAIDLLPLAKASDHSLLQALPTPGAFSSGALLHGQIWLGGPGGLVIYETSRATPRLLTPGIDLPPAPVVAVAAGLLRGQPEPQLIAATHGAGVLLFMEDGRASQLLPRDPAIRDITAVLPLGSGDLLLGTPSRGVLLYRGALMGGGGHVAGATLQPFAPGLRNVNVTALAGTDGDLWVGTRNVGVLHWHAGQLDTFGTENGLPDPQVESLAVARGRAFAGTPLGIAEFRDGKFVRTLAPGLFAHALALADDRLLVGTIDQGLQEIPLAAASARPATRIPLQTSSASLQAAGFFTAERRLFVVAAGRVFERTAREIWTPRLSTPASPLTDRNIAALNLTPDGRLWIGYFTRGLDVWQPGSAHAQHVEDDHLFCIDRIVNDPLRHTVDVATANGLAIFDPASLPLRARSVLLRRDGLIADHINDIAFTGDTTVLATPAGLTFLSPHSTESLYAFGGLVNNHVYAVSASAEGSRVLAGTLGGLSLMRGEQVERNLTVANSELKHNWITALLAMPASPSSSPDGAAFLLGTYGAGVMALDPSGHVSAIANATSPSIINPNALLRTATHIYAGTLSDGLLVYNFASQRWSHFTGGLPSLNVTSLAAANGTLYIGTDNGLVRAEEARLSP